MIAYLFMAAFLAAAYVFFHAGHVLIALILLILIFCWFQDNTPTL